MSDVIATGGLPSVIGTLLLRSQSARAGVINSTVFKGSPLLSILAQAGAIKPLESSMSIAVKDPGAAVTTYFETVNAAGTVTSSLSADLSANLLMRHYMPAFLNSSLMIDARKLQLIKGQNAIIDYLTEVTMQHANTNAVGFNGLVLSGFTATAGTANNISGLATQLPVVARVSSAPTVHASDHGGIYEAAAARLAPKRLVNQTITSATVVGLIRQMAASLKASGVDSTQKFALATQSGFLDLAAAMDGKFSPTQLRILDLGFEGISIGQTAIIMEGGLDEITIKGAVADADTFFFIDGDAVKLYSASGASIAPDANVLFTDSGDRVISDTNVNNAIRSQFFGQLVVEKPMKCGVLTTSSTNHQ
jgi:hypothetical protein